MSRYCGETDTTLILEASDRWRNEALLGDGSVFTNKHLWTESNLEELNRFFVQNMDDGDEKFLKKLESQLEPTTPASKQLAAEMIWLMYLCPSSLTASHKRDVVQKIWSWSGEVLSQSTPMLGEDFLNGIGSAGPGFNLNLWRELVFFINFMRRFKALSVSEKNRLLADGWVFADWLKDVPDSQARQLRHMLLFLMFPDEFERIFGQNDRRAVVKALSGTDTRTINKLEPIELDRLLRETRRKLEEEYGTTKLDYYEQPLRSRWKTEDAPLSSSSLMGADEQQALEESEPRNSKGIADTKGALHMQKVTLDSFIEQSHLNLNQAGLRVPDSLLIRLGAALLAKRFLILTGLSGSGKTKLAHAFAAWLTPDISLCDPFFPGAKIKSDRVTYIVRTSDRISVEFSNNEDDSHETLVALPRALIAEWASYISRNRLVRETPARQIRDGVSGTSNYSAQLHSFETHLKAAAFALLGAEESNQQHPFYRVVAVGADWTTNENVVGYMDALQDNIYRKPSNGALDVILRAELDPARPYFLILDEMNLSHVERYFADILSAIESGQEIALHSSAESLRSSENDTLLVPPKISLPKNLFVIGTVNVDETTYMFSPKVLDRANVIEFRATADDIAAFLDAPSAVNMELLAGKGAAFGAAFVAEAAAEVKLEDDTATELKARLAEVFAALAPIGAEFGYRTAYEITRFTHYHGKLAGAAWQFNDALDAQVLQKLMPKLHGSQRRLEPVLKALETFCTVHHCNASLEKIKRMQDRLKDGFTSFAEA